METRASVPAGFEQLLPHVENWGLPTFEARVRKRTESSIEELNVFHAAMLPHLETLIEFLNGWSLDEIPDEYRPLGCAVLAMCEVDNAVVRWKTPILPSAQDPRTVLFKKDFFDIDPDFVFEKPTFPKRGQGLTGKTR